MDEKSVATYFQLFNEIGIINQLSSALLDSKLPDGLISAHFGVLNHLIRVNDGATPLKLASAFQVAKTTMSHTLMGLEKNELVEMGPNPADKRSKQVWITQKGREVRDNAIYALVPEFAKAAEHFDVQEFENALPFLTRLREYMDKARD